MGIGTDVPALHISRRWPWEELSCHSSAAWVMYVLEELRVLFAPQVCAFASLHPGDRRRAGIGFARSSFSWREEVFYMEGRPPLAMLVATAGGGDGQRYQSACPAASCDGQDTEGSGHGQGLGGCEGACPHQPGIPTELVWLCPGSPSPMGTVVGLDARTAWYTSEGGRQRAAAGWDSPPKQGAGCG